MNMKKFITELLIYNIILLAFFHNPHKPIAPWPVHPHMNTFIKNNTIKFIIFIPVGEKVLTLFRGKDWVVY